MYESMSAEKILENMLARVPSTLDKREGSVIYDALAPAAFELANLYVQAEHILEQSFADTAGRAYLVRRCAERGVVPYPATKAVFRGEFSQPVPLGSRFSLDELNYTVIQVQDNGVQLECETLGSEGNRHFGQLIPIDYIQGLESAQLTELLIPGEDEEGTEALRQRYFASLQSQAFGGNLADYRDKVGAIPGVGGVRVHPVWQGGGTVKLVITSSEYMAPTQALVELVQKEIDPQPGQGIGLAPIGHKVTVIGAAEIPVNIASTLTFQAGYDWAAVEPQLRSNLESYLLSLRQAWAGGTLVVRVSQVENTILNTQGVLDVTGTTINDHGENLALEDLPVLGVLNG